MFWDDLKVVLNSLNINIRFDIKNVFFGILHTDNISILDNYNLLPFLKENILFTAVS